MTDKLKVYKGANADLTKRVFSLEKENHKQREQIRRLHVELDTLRGFKERVRSQRRAKQCLGSDR